MKLRLQKIIASAGLASRREAERWIADGKVRVNNQVIVEPGTLADPDKDRIKVNGKLVPKPSEKMYLILNKPPSCLTTMAEDKRRRKTVMDFISKVPTRVFPVGRLDYNTQGLCCSPTMARWQKNYWIPNRRFPGYTKSKSVGSRTIKP